MEVLLQFGAVTVSIQKSKRKLHVEDDHRPPKSLINQVTAETETLQFPGLDAFTVASPKTQSACRAQVFALAA